MREKARRNKMDILAEDISNKDKVNWESECCHASALGELSHAWFEIQKGGDCQKLRQGVCATCGQLAHFVEEPT